MSIRSATLSLSVSLSSYCHSPVSVSTQRASACRSDPPLYARLRASVVVLSSSRPLSSASPPSTVWKSPSLSATTTDATIDTASTSGELRLTHLSKLERSCAALSRLFGNMHGTMLRHTHTTGRRTCFWCGSSALPDARSTCGCSCALGVVGTTRASYASLVRATRAWCVSEPQRCQRRLFGQCSIDVLRHRLAKSQYVRTRRRGGKFVLLKSLK